MTHEMLIYEKTMNIARQMFHNNMELLPDDDRKVLEDFLNHLEKQYTFGVRDVCMFSGLENNAYVGVIKNRGIAYPIAYALLSILTEYLESDLENMEDPDREGGRICPKCGNIYFEPPAMSRIDGSDICSQCGVKEALQAAGLMQFKGLGAAEVVPDPKNFQDLLLTK